MNKGIRLIGIPAIQIEMPFDADVANKINSNALRSNGIIFASKWGVRSFFYYLDDTILARLKEDFHCRKIKIYCVGSATKTEAEKFLQLNEGIVAPENFFSDGLIATLEKENLMGKKFLIPKSNIGSSKVADFIRKNGGKVTTVSTYKTVKKSSMFAMKRKENIRKKLIRNKGIFLGITSPSNWESIIDVISISHAAELKRIYSIGPVTTKKILEYGIDNKKIVQAEEYSLNGLITAIINDLNSKS